MKTRILILMLISTVYGFSQSVNDYKAVIIPLKFDFQKSENQYRLQTFTKINLQKAGFQAFYANEPIPASITDRCSILFFDVEKENAFLISKLFITFKDCYGTEVYKSNIGKSREKEFDAAYKEALNEAFVSVFALNYTYNGNTNFGPKAGNTAQSLPIFTPPAVATPAPATDTLVVIPRPPEEIVPVKIPSTQNYVSENLLYAQPTSYGYQLIDSEPKVVMKVYKTSNPASFMAKKGELQGVLVSKNNQWFFEYYQNDQLISEKLEVKF